MRVTVELTAPRWLVSVTKRQRFVASIVLAFALALVPTVALANHIFGDVPTGAFYHDAVTRIFNAGITTGCSASPMLYCPEQNVTRGQMAVFLDRALGLNGTAAPGTYVSKAKTVDDGAITGAKVLDGSLTGADIANSSLTGAKVADGSLTGLDIALNSLTGTDIDESTLVGVNAATVGGIKAFEISYRGESPTGYVIIFNQGGLTLYATCSSTGDLEVIAYTSRDNSVLRVFAHNNAIAVADWDAGVGGVDIVNLDDNTAGMLVYARPDGITVTMSFVAEEDPFGLVDPDEADCVFAGTAFVTP